METSLGYALSPLKWPIRDLMKLVRESETQLCNLVSANIATFLLVDEKDKEAFLVEEEGPLNFLVNSCDFGFMLGL